MKLLVAIDYSQPSQQVIDEVTRRPWPAATTACVLHVVDWAQLPSSAALIEAMNRSAKVLVKSASEKLSKAGVQATVKVLEGHSRIAIAEYAKKWDADLVLVGSHGVGGLVRFLLGSVAQATLRRSPCSVEIVRRPAWDSADSFDGDENSGCRRRLGMLDGRSKVDCPTPLAHWKPDTPRQRYSTYDSRW